MKKLKLAPCALAFSLATISLAGCGYNNFSYVIDASEGEFVAEGKIAYELLKNYKLIELKLLNGENKLYIVSKQSVTEGVYLNSTYGAYYKDIFTREAVYDSRNENQHLELINEYELVDYLLTYDEVKGNYSIEDIERLYNKILEDYEFEKDKTLVNE